MRHGTVLKMAAAGMARRLVQTAVVFVVLGSAATAAVVGLTLAATPTLAIQAVSARYHIADLAVTIDAAKATSAQIAGTRTLPGVTGADGYPATTVDITIPASPGYEGGVPVSGPVTVVGRASRSGPLDDLTQKTGRWPARQGEIAMNDLSLTRGSVGLVTTATVTSVPGKPKLTIVGFASLPVQDNTQDTWALPSQVTALEKAGAPRQELMLYTFSQASTAAQVSADLGELRKALPAGAITGYATALSGVTLNDMGGGIRASSTAPYAIMALLLAAVIVASAAAGAVTAGYRRIGVLKSIGFTPAQVVAVYLTQLGIPALAGSLAGTALGNKWVLPRIQINPVFNLTVAVPLWIDIAVPAGMLALTVLAALVPAVRAGRLPALQAITAGQAPRAGHGHGAQRLAGRLPLPRPVTAGLAAPFARPARSAATLATITVGMTAAVLAAGLSTQITRIVFSTGVATIDRALFQRVTWLVIILAGIGAFSTLLTQARERVHDLGVHKALGMTPRQVITMVTCWAIAPAMIAAAIALPAGALLEPVVARAIVSAQADPSENMAALRPGGPGQNGVPPHQGPGRGTVPPNQRPGQTVLPPSQRPGQRPPAAGTPFFTAAFDVAGRDPYTPGELTLLALAGLGIALGGALGPAVWAAASRTTTALRAE